MAWAALAQAAERAVVVGGAVCAMEYGAERAGGIVAVLAAVYLVRGGLFALVRVAARARLLEAVVASVLADSAAATTGPDAELALLDGIDAGEEILGGTLPALVGDVAASVLLIVVVAVLEPARLVLEGGCAILVGAMVAAMARRVAAASATRQWEALMPALLDVETAVRGHLEIVLPPSGVAA